MLKNWKNFLSLCLCPLMVMGCFAACAAKPAPIPTTEPAPTEPAEEAKVLKILTLGSSSTVDACHMLNLILGTEGTGAYEEVLVGTLYYSGCKLSQHVSFLSSNSPEYTLYLSSSATPHKPPETTEGMTMETALKFNYWDIIFMQASGGDLDQDGAMTNGDIQTIQNYVQKHKYNPLAYFGWHFTCVPPTNPELLNKYPYDPNPYIAIAAKYNNDREACYKARAGRVEKYIFSDESFELKICSITAVMNACTSYLEEIDLYRDYTHSTDLARVMTAYVWYCRLMGIDKLEEIKLDAIPKQFLKSTADKTQDRVITDAEKAIILESVNNALAHPLEITQSQYTEAPNGQ